MSTHVAAHFLFHGREDNEKTRYRDKSRLNSVDCAGCHANYDLQRVVFVVSCSFHRSLPTTPLQEVDNDILCLDGKRLLFQAML